MKEQLAKIEREALDAITGAAEGTVRSRLSRARERLRSLLGGTETERK